MFYMAITFLWIPNIINICNFICTISSKRNVKFHTYTLITLLRRFLRN